MSDIRTIRSYGHDTIYIDGLTKGPAAGWRWDGAMLRHPAGIGLRMTPAAAARIDAAIAAYVPGTTERKTGLQVSQLPEADRQGWEWTDPHWGEHEHDNGPGWYIKSTPATPGICQFTTGEVAAIAA